MERVMEIAMLLLESETPLTVDQVADKLAVSNRTVRHDYERLGELLAKTRLALVKKAGVGAWISGAEEDKIELLRTLQRELAWVEPYSPVGRQNHILTWLFFGGQRTTIYSLSEALYISTSTVYQDLKPVSDWLAEYGLTLVKQRSRGLAIVGEERNYRKAMASFLLRLRDEGETNAAVAVITSAVGRLDTATLEQMKKLVDIDYACLTAIVERLEERLQFRFTQEAYTSLLMHIAIALKRMEAGKYVPPAPEVENNIRDTWEYAQAESVAAELATAFQVELPPGETVYLALHILGSRLQEKDLNDFANRFSKAADMDLVMAISRDIAVVASDALHLPLAEDAALLHGLVLHLRPAVNRLKYGLTLRNPLLADIKEHYGDIFGVAWMSSRIFAKYLNVSVPESEIGYITLHLAAAVARHLQRVKALVVCHSGVGTSQLLSERLRSSFRELEIVGVLAAAAVPPELLATVDVVVSTVPFACSKPVLVISPLFTQQDIRKVEWFLREQQAQEPEALEIVYFNAQAASTREFFAEVGAMLAERGWVQPGFAASLQEREDMMSTEVGKGIAIPHGDAALVQRSVLVLAAFPSPIRWKTERVQYAFIPVLRKADTGLSRRFFRNLCREMAKPDLAKALQGTPAEAIAFVRKLQE